MLHFEYITKHIFNNGRIFVALPVVCLCQPLVTTGRETIYLPNICAHIFSRSHYIIKNLKLFHTKYQWYREFTNSLFAKEIVVKFRYFYSIKCYYINESKFIRKIDVTEIIFDTRFFFSIINFNCYANLKENKRYRNEEIYTMIIFIQFFLDYRRHYDKTRD